MEPGCLPRGSHFGTVVVNARSIVHLTCAFCQTYAGRGRNANCVGVDVIPLCGFLSPARATKAKAMNSPSIAIMIGFMGSLLAAVMVYADWIVAAESAVVFRTSLGDRH